LLSGSLCASFKEVEHRCQQCGTTVEDGRPFCPQCRAPQISVKVAIADAEPATDLNPAPDQFSSETTAEGKQASSGRALDRGIAARAALKAGLLGVFIGMIPLLGIVLTGALAVYFYRRESRFTLPSALGSRLGGAAGVVAFAINALLLTIRIFVFHAQQEYIDFLTRFAHTAGLNAADPDFQAGIHTLLTPSGLALTFLFGMMISVVLAAVGGALASLFLRPRNPRV
jgi:hypothetical protein